MKMKMTKTKMEYSPADFHNTFKDYQVGQIARQIEMKQIMYAMLTREHVLLNGKPGTGKSQLAMNALALVGGAQVFSAHLTKQTTEEYVFGPINIEKLRSGVVEHNIEDSILDADFAFLDEFFDASDVLLRALLGILNEREWKRGAQSVKCPMRTAILTSNYTRDNDLMEAVTDRILFKSTVQPLRIKKERQTVYEDYLDGFEFTVKKPLLKLKDLDDFYHTIQEKNAITIPESVLKAYDMLVQEFSNESKKYVSQRTANKMLKIPKARALLQGRKQVIFEDLYDVRLALCEVHVKKEEDYFEAVYEKFVQAEEESEKYMEQLDEVEKFTDDLSKDIKDMDQDEFVEVIKEVNRQKNILLEGDYPTDRVSNRARKIAAKLSKVVQKYKGRLFEVSDE